MSMGLSDRQIDRYSRQIVLPEIGGRGQQRLLDAAIAIFGGGEVAATAARYLAGAGIGELRLDGGAASLPLAAALRALNDDVVVRSDGGDAAATAFIAVDLPLADLDHRAGRARALGVPLIAAGRHGRGGWLLRGAGCASCAARLPIAGDAAPDAALDPVAAGVLGTLVALAALTRALGRDDGGAPLLWFDATTAALSSLAPSRRDGCPACGPRR